MNSLKRLIREIHRRSLWQVLGIYLAGSWLAFEIVERIAESAGLPEWIPPFALILLVIGLPVVLATAYVQEGTPDVTSADSLEELDDILAGDEPTSGTRTPLERLFNWRNAVLGGVSAFVLLTTVSLTWMSVAGGDLPSSLAGAFNDARDVGPIDQSVAVLPFVNMSANPENEYFSDGITEELLNALAQIPNLRVPARTSSFAFKGQNVPIRQIADTLGVAHVLEGSVRRDGERVLITAQLVDAQADAHLWSDTFERELDDIFAIQREIAEAIADQLELTLSGETQARLATAATEIPEAHEAYLRGRYLLENRTPESLENAIAQFQRATELDPRYAEAFAGLADTYVLQASFGWLPEVNDFRRRTQMGLAASERATELDPDLGLAYTSRGFGLWNLGEWNAAEEAFEAAIRLAPQSALAHQWYGLHLFTTGSVEEGVREAERAVELDPLYRQGYRNLAWGLAAAGRLEEAISVNEELRALAPDWFMGWHNHAVLRLRNGDGEEAVASALEAARLGGYDVEGYEEAWRAAARFLQTGQPQTVRIPEGLDGLDAVGLYVNTGQLDHALDMIQVRVDAGILGVTALGNVVYWLGAIHDDPRYQALLDEAGITW